MSGSGDANMANSDEVLLITGLMKERYFQYLNDCGFWDESDQEPNYPDIFADVIQIQLEKFIRGVMNGAPESVDKVSTALIYDYKLKATRNTPSHIQEVVWEEYYPSLLRSAV